MGVILMLMTVGGLIVASLLLVFPRITKKNWLKHFVWGGLIVWFAAYIFLFFCASFFSQEKALGLNEPKEFCGFYLDCHLHAAVTNVRTAKTLGDKTASGEFYIVKVKVFSDAKQSTLGLLTVDARVVDGYDREFTRDALAEAQISEQPPFERQISPVESFEKEIVFDLPADAVNPRLDIREGYGIDRAIEAVLIGDEDSLFHKRIRFNLEQPRVDAGLR